jgi:hypothetical protein
MPQILRTKPNSIEARSFYKIKDLLELRRILVLIRDLTVVKNIERRAAGKEELITRDILASSPSVAAILRPHLPRSLREGEDSQQEISDRVQSRQVRPFGPWERWPLARAKPAETAAHPGSRMSHNYQSLPLPPGGTEQFFGAILERLASATGDVLDRLVSF